MKKVILRNFFFLLIINCHKLIQIYNNLRKLIKFKTKILNLRYENY